MTETSVNIPLLRKAVEWAEAEAAKPFELCEWRQAMWVTTFDEDATRKWKFIAQRTTREALGKAPECGTCYCIAGYVVAAVDGREHVSLSTEERAAQLLGLPGHSDLFDAVNTIEDVRRIAEDIAGERL